MSPIVVFANGQARQVPQGTTLGELVASLGFPESSVLVELNGEIPPRAQWATQRLEHGDRIELFRVVAGG